MAHGQWVNNRAVEALQAGAGAGAGAAAARRT